MQPTEINAEQYTELVKSDKPAAVYFYSLVNCDLCPNFDPTFSNVADEFSGKVGFFKYSIDGQELPPEVKIGALPTVLLISHGEVVQQLSGEIAKADLEAAVNKAYG